MSNTVFPDLNPSTESGTDLAEDLNDFKDAVMSGMTGTSRPIEMTAGGSWIDTTNEGSPNFYWIYNIYDGTNDIEIFRVDLATGIPIIQLTESLFSIKKVSADAVGPILKLIKNRIASSGQVVAGDVVGEIRFIGRANDASDPNVASIQVIATDTETSSASGSYMVWYTTPTGTTSAVEHMRLKEGLLGVGTQAADCVIHAKGVTGIKSEHSSDDAVGPKVTLQKSRIASTGAVQTSDVLGELDVKAKDSSSALSITAQVEATALEGHTSSNKGTIVKVKTMSTGTNTLSSKLEIGDKVESKVVLKVNSLEQVAQSISTAATIAALNTDDSIVEMTGSTATDIQGIDATGKTKTLLISNISSANVTLKHENGSASASNRIKLPKSQDVVIIPQQSYELFYSVTDSRWKLKASAAFDTLSPMTAAGDLPYGGVSGAVAVLPAGTDGQYLKQVSGIPAWANSAGASTKQLFTATGSTTGYVFATAAISVTAGATYTNNGQTFTVLSTLSSSTPLMCTGTGAPQASGTLTKATGSGPATIAFTAVQTLGTYTTPAGCTLLKITMTAGGGGGGGAGSTASNSHAGGGGGGAGTVIKWVTSPAGTYYYAVGTGGAGGTAGANAGTDGLDTYFDIPSGLWLRANGGIGGTASVAGTTTKISGQSGTFVASALRGDINMNGQIGMAGIIYGTTGAVGGLGGSCFLGTGGYGISLASGNSGGGTPRGYGSGGGGAISINGSSAAAGANGANGIIIVEEFY